MNIVLYFGSFNPIHHGHLIIATHTLNEVTCDEVWFVVSPQNPLKKAASLLNENHRLHLVNLAIENEPKLRATNVEFNLPRPSFTIDTLTYLKEKYPQHQFSILLGGDSYSNISKWKNYESLLHDFHIYIYNRPGFETNIEGERDIKILQAPLLDISSTYIRKLIKEKKNIRFLLPETVRNYIEDNNYYKK